MTIRGSRAVVGSVATVATVAALAVAAQSPPAAARPAVPPVPRVVSVQTLDNGPRHAVALDGTEYSPLNEPSFILGHDNGQSALYDNGKGLRFSFWSFGDTFLNPGGLLSNTGASTTDLSMDDSISRWNYYSGNPPTQQFIPLTADEIAYNKAHTDTDPTTDGCQPGPGIPADECGLEYATWGGSVVADPQHHRILAFYGVVTRSGTQFHGQGTGVAVWSEQDGWSGGFTREIVTHPSDPSQPTLLWLQNAFDTGMVVRGGFLYAFGCYGGEQLRHDCHLARVPMNPANAIWDRSAWRFYDGSGWSSDMNAAAPIPADGSPATMTGGAAGTSVFWNPALHEYMAIYGVPLSDEIDYSVAYRLEGPWSKAAKLADGLPAAGTGLASIDYADFAHPEYAQAGGLTQYVTYAHTTGTFTSDFPVLKVTFARSSGGR